MYYGEYEDYKTNNHYSKSEAINDIITYMGSNNIIGEFKIYYVLPVSSNAVISLIKEYSILEVIHNIAIKTYGDVAKNYLKVLDAEALKKFKAILYNYKRELEGWTVAYGLKPDWYTTIRIETYKYDSDKKVWAYIQTKTED